MYVIGLHIYCRCCQLENVLLGKCEDESGNLNSKLDVEVVDFNIFLYSYSTCLYNKITISIIYDVTFLALDISHTQVSLEKQNITYKCVG
jgi:hypothetical protein